MKALFVCLLVVICFATCAKFAADEDTELFLRILAIVAARNRGQGKKVTPEFASISSTLSDKKGGNKPFDPFKQARKDKEAKIQKCKNHCAQLPCPERFCYKYGYSGPSGCVTPVRYKFDAFVITNIFLVAHVPYKNVNGNVTNQNKKQVCPSIGAFLTSPMLVLIFFKQPVYFLRTQTSKTCLLSVWTLIHTPIMNKSQ